MSLYAQIRYFHKSKFYIRNDKNLDGVKIIFCKLLKLQFSKIFFISNKQSCKSLKLNNHNKL